MGKLDFEMKSNPNKRRTMSMIRCVSLFSQLIALFNRKEFYRLVVKNQAERYAKGYSSWDHYIARALQNQAKIAEINFL